jgi:serine/threonine-protein kinase
VALEFEAACREPSVLARLETLPPAALMDAAPARREAVVRDPDMLKRISI